MGQSQVILGSDNDYNANGTSERFNLDVRFDDNGALRSAVDAARGGAFRVAVDPNDAGTSTNVLVGLYDEDSRSPRATPYLVIQTSPNIDFDFDGDVDTDDIDALADVIISERHFPEFEITGDGLVTREDLDAWLVLAGAANLGPGQAYLAADANLDGAVDGQDFVAWNNAKFAPSNRWSDGDFDTNGIVDGQDFIIWNNFKFQSADNFFAASGQQDDRNDSVRTRRDELIDLVFEESRLIGR